MLLGLAGCAPCDEAVLAQAREDLFCEDVVAYHQRSRRGTDDWIVEGCGRMAHYRCFDTCERTSERELPGQKVY